jgi:hypothetical protein
VALELLALELLALELELVALDDELPLSEEVEDDDEAFLAPPPAP